MRHLPEVCVSICGAVGLVAVVVLPWARRTGRRWREYVTVRDVPTGDGEYLA